MPQWLRRSTPQLLCLVALAGWWPVLAVPSSAPKVVLAEDFTATWCADCPNARCALEIMLQEFGGQLIVAEHHVLDILDSDWTNDRRGLYHVGPIPHVQFDGKYQVVGAHSCSQAAEAYREVIHQRLAEVGGVSPVGISGRWWLDDETVTLTATFELLAPDTLVDAQAHLLALEDDITWQGCTYNHVTRGAYSEPVALSEVGDSATVTAQFDIGVSWDLAQLGCIAFLQTMSGDHEIHQAAQLRPIVDFSLEFTRTAAGLPDGQSLAIFQGTLTNAGESADELTLSLDNQFGWYAEFLLAGEARYGTDPVVRTLDPGEELGVTLRVFTDSAVRIGSGYLVTRSAVTGAVRANRARVFNGSPALLLVDDDYVDDSEALITAALDSTGYLYDLWQVYVEHLNQAPSAARLADYDALIWHHGWASSDLLTAADVQALMIYLDGGGRLLLSSQDYLGSTAPNDFTQGYLGLEDWSEDVGASELSGVPLDPISEGMNFVLDYPGPEANRADALVPSGIASLILHSELEQGVALRADNGTGRTVFLAFGVNAMDETAPDPDNPATLIDRSLGWLCSTAGTEVPEDPQPLRKSRIAALRPNPCGGLEAGGGLAIRLAIEPHDVAGNVRLDLVDVSGRWVRTLLDRPLAAGSRLLSWDGCDAQGRPLDSGLYHLRLRCGGTSDCARIVLVR